MNKPEILAPAGTKEAMIGAINAGAHAIYLAGKRFGARAYANNFDDEVLIEMINYAHLRGVLVFVAVNTLMFDDEIDDLLTYTDMLVLHDVDAFIVQDLGVIDLLIKRYPNVDIHASTQVNTHSIEQVKWLKQLGVKRIVLARETSLDLIKLIKKHVDIELEVFVHGVLCVCYSGNCLMSSMIGGRSGNRGECAQPCRLPYRLYKNEQKITDQSYLLSTKDLMTIEYMDELVAAGIDSFKIEGRMRKPEYVIQTVISYKEALDASLMRRKMDLEQSIWKLKKVFNREYTKGLMMNEIPKEMNNSFRPNHMGIEVGVVVDYKDNKAIVKLSDTLSINDGYRIIGDHDYGNSVSRIIKGSELVKKAFPGDVIKLDVTEKINIGSIVLKTSDQELEESLAIYLDENYKTIHLSGQVIAEVDDYFQFSISDDQFQVSVLSSEKLEKAQKLPVLKAQIVDQMSKLGQTPFVFDYLEVKTDNLAFISIKMMNDLRRKAIDQMIELRTQKKKEIVINNLVFESIKLDNQQPKMVLKVQTLEQYEYAKEKQIQSIFYENILNIKDENAIPVLKRMQLRAHEPLTRSSMIQDIGHLASAKTFDLYTDSFFNVTNIYTIHLLHRMGVKRITLSPELTLERIQKMIPLFIKRFNYYPQLELEVYGRIDLMITKYCPIAKTFKTMPDCHLCEKNQYYLEDRMNQKFPLIHDGHCNLRILHAKTLNITQYMDELFKLNITCRIHLTTEKKEEIQKVLAVFDHFKPISYQSKDMTLGRLLV